MIENYLQLQSVRKTTCFLRKTVTVKEAIHRIARRGTIDIKESDEDKYDLIILNNGMKLDRLKTVGDYNLRNMETLILRQKTSNGKYLKLNSIY